MEVCPVKTAISIPDKLFIAADIYAKNIGVSRSHLYAKAIADFLEQRSINHVTQQLNDIYTNEHSLLNRSLSTMQFDSMEKQEW